MIEGVRIIAQIYQMHDFITRSLLAELSKDLAKSKKKPGRYTPPKKKRK